jgi:organic hydroperoxide reductase OsmC/OhrA
MQNASVFAKEEKISMTKVAQMLESAHTACFTVCFTAKVDDKVVKEKITATSYVDIQDKAKAK